MTAELVVELLQRTIETALYLAAPALIVSLAVGFLVGLLQAVTQINEITLTFVPKIIAIAVAFIFFLPWMISIFVGFSTTLFIQIPNYVR